MKDSSDKEWKTKMADTDPPGQYVQVVVGITGASDSQVLSIDPWDNCPFEVAKEEGLRTMKRKPAAFMSYAHVDDKYGHLTEFRERLSHEVQVQTGEKFPIFQDHNDIQWGQTWEALIEEALYEVTFFIPIITPSFFKSQACRDGLKQFIEREKELKRDDLILPVYYVDCPLLNDEAERAIDELAQVIYAHQWADWRDIRHYSWDSQQVCKALERLAVQIRDALERVQASLMQDAESISESEEITRRPSAKTEPRTLVVDKTGDSKHTTITEAIRAANPGDRILVCPGLYREGLIMDKPLEIIGDADPGEVMVEAEEEDALSFMTMYGRVANMTLRQIGGEDCYSVDIAQGRLEVHPISSWGKATLARSP